MTTAVDSVSLTHLEGSMVEALRTRGVLVSLTVAAFVAAASRLTFAFGSFPVPKPLWDFIVGAAYPTMPVLAWVLLAGSAFACVAHESQHHRRENAQTFVGFGVGLLLISVGAMVWWADIVLAPHVHYVGQFIFATLVAGYAVVAGQCFALAARLARRSPIPSAVSALVVLVGLGVSIGALTSIAAMAGWHPGFYPFYIGMGVSIGLAGLAFVIAGGLRLSSPPTMFGVAVGLLLVAWGSATDLTPLAPSARHGTDLVSALGFIVLGCIAGYRAFTLRVEERHSQGEPDLPLLGR